MTAHLLQYLADSIFFFCGSANLRLKHLRVQTSD
jgi:hypothetical protein